MKIYNLFSSIKNYEQMTSTQTLFTWIGEKDSDELKGDTKQLYSHSSKTISSIIASDKYHFDNLVSYFFRHVSGFGHSLIFTKKS